MSEGRYSVRTLRASDVPALVEVIRTVRREYGLGRRIQTLIEPSDEDLHGTYLRARSSYFVALYGNVAVGGGGIGPLAGGDDEICELQRMYLLAAHRRSGIGRLLLSHCIAAARECGYRTCYAETVSEMQEALAFYEVHGFRRLEGPLGSSGHSHNDCWLMLDLSAKNTD